MHSVALHHTSNGRLRLTSSKESRLKREKKGYSLGEDSAVCGCGLNRDNAESRRH